MQLKLNDIQACVLLLFIYLWAELSADVCLNLPLQLRGYRQQNLLQKATAAQPWRHCRPKVTVSELKQKA